MEKCGLGLAETTSVVSRESIQKYLAKGAAYILLVNALQGSGEDSARV